jgi:hypothetical protein
MAQLYPFHTEYMRKNFSTIIGMCAVAAYNEQRFNDVILPTLITGLTACDGAAGEMKLTDIYDAALNLHIDPNNTAVTESFALGAAIALHEPASGTGFFDPVSKAVQWMAPHDPEDYKRIAYHRSNEENTTVTTQDTMEMPILDAVMALIDSYIV